MPHLFHLYSEFISQDEEQADKLTSLDKSKARVELRDYAPLDEMRTTCKSRVRYAEQGFNQFVFLDRLKESIKDLHQPTPRALIFTQTSAANRSFLIKEAFKNAFPDEKIPVFLTVNVKPIRYNKKPHYNRQLRDFDKQNPELVENISQEIRRKLKDYGIKEGEVIVVDEFPASDYSYSDNNGCGRYEVPRTGSTLQIATDIVRKATMLEGLNVKVRSYNFMPLSQWNPNFAYGPWIKYHNDDTRCDRANTPEERQISRKNIAYLKSIGKVVGLQIKEEDRNKSLEQKVSGATALVGILGGSIFVGSNFTGNTIVNLSNSTFSWIGGVLFCVGLVGAFFWIRSKRR
jgi:hypothetical protein